MPTPQEGKEEAARLTQNQFIHDCGMEPSDELALKWFQARCLYLQEQLLSSPSQNEIREAVVEIIKEKLWVESFWIAEQGKYRGSDEVIPSGQYINLAVAKEIIDSCLSQKGKIK